MQETRVQSLGQEDLLEKEPSVPSFLSLGDPLPLCQGEGGRIFSPGAHWGLSWR